MTDADQIAWNIAAENPIPATDDLAKSIANALREAEERGEARGRTAGFNEAKERAVEIVMSHKGAPSGITGLIARKLDIRLTPGRRALEEGTGR